MHLLIVGEGEAVRFMGEFSWRWKLLKICFSNNWGPRSKPDDLMVNLDTFVCLQLLLRQPSGSLLEKAKDVLRVGVGKYRFSYRFSLIELLGEMTKIRKPQFLLFLLLGLIPIH
jgi:hypothetical protein